MARVLISAMGLRRIGQVIWALVGLGLIALAMAVVGLLFVLAIRAGSAFGAALLAALATVGAAVLVRDFERRRVMEAIRREQLGSTYNQMAQVLHGQEMPEKNVSNWSMTSCESHWCTRVRPPSRPTEPGLLNYQRRSGRERPFVRTRFAMKPSSTPCERI